jgi:uncharacterized protein YuzE
MGDVQLTVEMSLNEPAMAPTAAYFRVREGRVIETRDVGKESVLFADYDATGRLLGVEVLAPDKVNVLSLLSLLASAEG